MPSVFCFDVFNNQKIDIVRETRKVVGLTILVGLLLGLHLRSRRSLLLLQRALLLLLIRVLRLCLEREGLRAAVSGILIVRVLVVVDGSGPLALSGAGSLVRSSLRSLGRGRGRAAGRRVISQGTVVLGRLDVVRLEEALVAFGAVRKQRSVSMTCSLRDGVDWKRQVRKK